MCGLGALYLAFGHGTVSAEESIIPASPFNGASNPAFSRWGGFPTTRQKPPPPPSSVAAKNRASDTAAAHRAQEEANFLRRTAVCDKLRRLALETGDDGLERQAEALQQKAESAYKERTTNIAAGNAGAQSDDKSRGGKR
jgi:hypothetical protein